MADRLELSGVTAVEMHGVRRVRSDFPAGDQCELLGRDLTGAGDEVHGRAGVVGDQYFFEFSGSSAEGVGEDLRDPQRVRVLEGETADRVLRGQQFDPLVLGAFGDAAQDRVDESRSALAVFGADEVDRGGDGSVRCDTSAQQLVRAESENIEQSSVDLFDRPTRCMRDDRIQEALSAGRAVRELGGQRSVACVEFAVAKQSRQNQVRVCVTFTNRAQDVTRCQTRLIEPGG
ncbi:hypothetical protein GCM10020255_080140 [Rhodococcus baikonurensis]